MEIDFHKKFNKKYKKADQKIKQKFIERLEIFKKNPYNKILNNHKLSGDFKGKRSINITGDVRAIYIEENNQTIFIFLDLGTHAEIYK